MKAHALLRSFTLTAIAVGSVAARAQLAGSVPPGSTPAGVVPPNAQLAGTTPRLNPVTGLPYPTGNYQSFWPSFRPISSVPVMLTGTSPAINRSMTSVIANSGDWNRMYLDLCPPLPGEQSFPPALTDFTNEVLIVVRLAGTNDLDVVPTIDSIERQSGVTSVVRYSIWMPLRNQEASTGGAKTVSIGDAVRDAYARPNPQDPKNQRDDKDKKKDDKKPKPKPVPPRLSNRSFSPFVVVKAPRTSGWYQFSGSLQYYQPYDWRDDRPRRYNRDGD